MKNYFYAPFWSASITPTLPDLGFIAYFDRTHCVDSKNIIFFENCFILRTKIVYVILAVKKTPFLAIFLACQLCTTLLYTSSVHSWQEKKAVLAIFNLGVSVKNGNKNPFLATFWLTQSSHFSVI